jgi:hypothetical protein
MMGKAEPADEQINLDWDRTEWNVFYRGRITGWVRLTPTGWVCKADQSEPFGIDPAIGEALYAAASGNPIDFQAAMLLPMVNALAGDGVLKLTTPSPAR